MSAPTAIGVSRGRGQKAALALIGLLGLAYLVHFPIFTSNRLDVDEASVGSIAQGLLRGGHLYGNLVDRKPPALFYLYAASFWSTHSNSLIPVRILIVGLEAVTGLVIGVALCQAWRHRLAIAALFIMGTATFAYNDAHAAGFEAAMLLPITLAWWFSRKGMAVAAALALVVAVLIKQPAAFTLLPVAYNLWHQPDGRRRLAIFTATGAVAYAVVALGVRAAVRSCSGTSPATAATSASTPWSTPIGVAVISTGIYAVSHVVMVWLAARAWPERKLQVDLWLWLASALVGVAVGGHFFGHYFFQVLPPLAALGATQIARGHPEQDHGRGRCHHRPVAGRDGGHAPTRPAALQIRGQAGRPDDHAATSRCSCGAPTPRSPGPPSDPWPPASPTPTS